MARNGFVPVETQGPDVERDDDLLGDDDGIFDSADDLFSDENASDVDGEGTFADATSVFSTPRDPSEDHSNALTTREMDARRYEDAKPHESMKVARQVYNKRAGFKQAPKRTLVAKFDEQGRPLVACFAGGKQLEPFRMPTEREFHALKTKGKIVKGGIGQAPTTTTSSIPWTKLLLVGGAAVAGGAAWYFWKRKKRAEVVESVKEAPVDESDDDGEEDESED